MSTSIPPELADADRVQVSNDQNTVWVHSDDGSTVGRFSKTFGMDVHTSVTDQLNGAAQCLRCTHEPAGEPQWLEFCELMQQHHGIKVDPAVLSFGGATDEQPDFPDDRHQLKAALVAACDHLSIHLSLQALRLSHSKDAALIEAALAVNPEAPAWPRLSKRMVYAAQDEFHILPPRLARLWARLGELHQRAQAKPVQRNEGVPTLPAGVKPADVVKVFETARAGSDRPLGILRGVRAVLRLVPGLQPQPESLSTQDLVRRCALALEVVGSAWRESDPNLRKDLAAWLAAEQTRKAQE